MDDVDEGIGSNESSASCSESSSLSDIKHLHRQNMDTNCSSDVSDKGIATAENGHKFDDENVTCSKDNHIHAFQSRSPAGSGCPTDSQNTITNGNYNDENDDDGVGDSVPDCDETENRNSASGNFNVQFESNIGDKTEEEDSEDVCEIEDDSQDASENELREAETEDAFKQSEGLAEDILQKNKDGEDKNLTVVTDFKTSETPGGHKSPASSCLTSFVLNDGMRKSLKGLQAKIKSFEKPKDEEITKQIDSDSEEKCSDQISDELASEQISNKTNSEDNFKNNTDVNDVELDPDDVLLKDEIDDGVMMVMGSDNEDELLNLSPPERKTDLKFDSSDKENTNSDCEKVDHCDEVAQKTTVESPEPSDMEEKSSSQEPKGNTIEDTDDVINISDNNSNGEPSLSNETNDDQDDVTNENSNDSSDEIQTNDKVIEEIQDDETPMEVDKLEATSEVDDSSKDIESEKNSNTDKTEDSMPFDDIQIIDCDEDNTKDSIDKEKVDKDIVSDDDTEKQSVPKKEEESSENAEVSGEINSEINSKDDNDNKEEDDDDDDDDNKEEDDDDVIFEGETKCEPKLDSEPTNKDGNKDSDLKSDTCDEEVEKNIDSANDKFDKDEDDDDVIFEKEVKPEQIESKQNCDKKGSSGDNSLTSKIEPKIEDNAVQNGIDKSKSLKDVKTSYVNGTGADRKRPAESTHKDQHVRKRTKLDLNGLIGKLHSRVDKANVASIELSDSDGECDTGNGSESMATDTASEMDNEMSKPVTESKKEKLIVLTKKEFDALVREQVKACLAKENDTLVTRLAQKVKELQLNNDLWKRQVKDLQLKVNDVTVLQQKLEKRKAATAALRQITTRNVAVQVEDGKTANVGKPVRTSLHSTPPKAVGQQMVHTPPIPGSGTIRLPIPQSSMAKPGLQSAIPQGAQMVTTPTVKSLLGTTCVQRTVSSNPLTQTTTSSVTNVLGVVQYPTQTFITQTSNNQQALLSVPASVLNPSNMSVQSNVSKTVSKSVVQSLPSAKVIDLTEDDDSSKNRFVALSQSMTINPGVRHVLTQPGTQLVRPGLPGQPYQLVLSSPSTGIRTLGISSPTATFVQSSVPLQSSQPALLALATPGNLTPGTSLARAAVPVNPVPNAANLTNVMKQKLNLHPAPFPPLPPSQLVAGLKQLPPKPSLKISRGGQGIVLSWNMLLTPDVYAVIASYQLYAYQETSAQPVHTLWKKVGEVKALPLPMACTLTQFQVGNKYHFAVRALDAHGRVSQFSDPQSIHLTPSGSS